MEGRMTSIGKEMNNAELLSLKADLLVWHNFNQKCKEIESKILLDVQK